MSAEMTGLWSVDSGTALLKGIRCSSCGLVLFPPQLYGCPACGAGSGELIPAALPAAGRLHSFAVVNLHPSHPTPYTILEVELDSGPLVRALAASNFDPRINDRVEGHEAQVDGTPQLVFERARVPLA